ncbi:MAG: hypothetical protein GY936_00200 [Ignavibacteriae bacterium]|nr:hypothetical protein [Ignavibacteriota bacterium]
MKNLIPKILLLVLFISASVFAQTNDTSASHNTLLNSNFEMQKSPTGAMLRSAVLPGWGQFYNESYWKVPIVWGVTGWFVYMWTDRNSEYKNYQDLYNKSLLESSNGDSKFMSLRDFYRDDRDLFSFYIGLTYFLNLIDAYVDAHLFDFDVGVNQFTQKPELHLRIKF